MISEAERDRIRAAAQAEVAENAPPPAGGQLGLLQSLLAPAVAEAAAARRTQEETAARGAA